MTTLIHLTSPITGEKLEAYEATPTHEVVGMGARAQRAFLAWRSVPAPRRAEVIRQFGNVLRRFQQELAQVITEESGKILAESRGEVQEMIDICDFAVGLSRQLYGLTIASERPGHRMMEQWHPLGPVLVISAFNFPAAVWAWNLVPAVVCGCPVIWKPSEKTPKTSMQCLELFEEACRVSGVDVPSDLLQVAYGGVDTAERLMKLPEVRLVSATGSCGMGKAVARTVAMDLGKRTLLELGGNNAMIVAPTADLKLATRAALFSAVGTAGQRCTSLRRLIAHEQVINRLTRSLKEAYGSIVIGDPRDPKTLVGPLIDASAAARMDSAIAQAAQEGGRIVCGGGIPKSLPKEIYRAAYRNPAIIDMPWQTPIVRQETFAPILYLMRYTDLEAAIAMQNDVPQGLSSSIFTGNMREAELFLSAAGSDCGIANVNIGPSGAEIGGAFGGEKDTGGGRESGSDSWKNYMRRATNTINFSDDLPLAQGISFGDK